MFFTKKTLIEPVVEQIGLLVLSNIKSRIRINPETPLKTDYFMGATFVYWGGREKTSLFQNKVEDLLEISFSA